MHKNLLVSLAVACLALGCGDDTASPPSTSLASVSVTPATLSLAAGATADLAASAKDVSGQTIASATGYVFTSANAAIATVSTSGKVLAVGAGTTQITATLALEGIAKSGTTAVTVTGALPQTLTVVAGAASNDYTPATGALAKGGTVTWTSGARPHNVIFSVTSGAPNNIPTGTNLNVSRTFATAGDFTYQCTVHQGMNALVYVR